MTAEDPASPEEIQRRIRQHRDRLLAGRGPGARPGETAPHMRDRQWLGGVPAAVARQHEADQAALAAHDLSAMADAHNRHRAELAASISALTARLHPLPGRAAGRLRPAAAAAAVWMAAMLIARRRQRRTRRRQFQ